MERAYLVYRGTHRRVSEPTWLTRGTDRRVPEPNLDYRGTHRIVSEPNKPSLSRESGEEDLGARELLRRGYSAGPVS
jgi:hypothetical protein